MNSTSQRKTKCREYNACRNCCLECNLLLNKKCNKEFDLDVPEKFISVERKDHFNIGWNECPTCGNSIGYEPLVHDYRCSRCGQRIEWY